MTLLDDPLIKKYFGCFKKEGEIHEHSYVDECSAQVAFHILAAMQEPIKKGERMLFLPGNHNPISEEVAGDDIPSSEIRCWLRLPSRFQPQAEKKKWPHLHRWSVTSCECGEKYFEPKPTPPKCEHADIGHFHGTIENPTACPDKSPAVDDEIEKAIKDIKGEKKWTQR